jgi:hypothetical protein
MSNIEYFRTESQRPVDANGFEIDSATREIAEIDAWFADQATHAVPSQSDVAWLNDNPSLPPIAGGAPEPFEPSAADWDDYARWSEYQDRLEGIYGLDRITDEDIEAAGLPVG